MAQRQRERPVPAHGMAQDAAAIEPHREVPLQHKAFQGRETSRGVQFSSSGVELTY